MRIIPAIDLIDGKCVRLHQGNYEKKSVYSDDPVDVARSFEDAGLEFLHLVDLDGARAGAVKQWKILERITSSTSLSVDFGGGVHTDRDIEIVFNSGAAQVTGGTVAVKNRPLFLEWLDRYGAERIILGADANRNRIAVSGWQEATTLDIIEYLKGYSTAGVKYVVATDISVDGTLTGPALNLYREIQTEVPGLKMVASGGVATLRNLRDLQHLGVDGAIVGKALYEGTIKLTELAELC